MSVKKPLKKKSVPSHARKPKTSRKPVEELAVSVPPEPALKAMAPAPIPESAQPKSMRKNTTIDLMEKGTSGLKTTAGFVDEAYNKTLVWPGVYTEYNRLRRSMPEMVLTRQFFTFLARATEPVVDLPEDPSDDDKRYQEFLMSDWENMDGGYQDWMEQTVSQLPFMGWARWEVLPSIRKKAWHAPTQTDDWESEEDDGLIGLRRLAWRDQGTLYKWEFDPNKRLLGMWQQDWPNPPVLLPNNKCLHLTIGDSFNPEGLSPLEAVVRLERIRYGYEVIMGIGFEHAAGYLDVQKTGEGDLTDTDTQQIQVAAMNVLTAKEGNYAAWPTGFQAEIKDVSFQAGAALLDAIQHYNILSLATYMMQFIAFNTLSGVGSNAAMQDASGLAIAAFNSMLDGIANQYDSQVGRKLYKWNQLAFPGLTKRPKIKFQHVEKDINLGELGTFINQISGVLALGSDDYKAIRARTGFLSSSLPAADDIGKGGVPSTVPDPSQNPGSSDTKPQPSSQMPDAKDKTQPPVKDAQIQEMVLGVSKSLMDTAMRMYSRGEFDAS